MRGCLTGPTGICVNVVEYESALDLVLPDGVTLAIDNTGEIGWIWNGAAWVTPSDTFNNLALTGTPLAPTPAPEVVSDQVATTSFVDQKIADVLALYFGDEFALNGGSYGDVDGVITLYNAGRYSGALNNLAADLESPIYDDTGGNLTADIDAGAYV